MRRHQCGSACSGIVEHLKKLAVRDLLVKGRDQVPVKTWCRVCGLPVLLEVLTDYESAVRYFCGLDDHPMAHRSIHVEAGGWGVHWRLDDVLSTVFPHLHKEEMWPKPIWWEERHGEAESEDQPIVVMSRTELRNYSDRYVDMEIRMLDEQVNRKPRTRHELMDSGEQVWDSREVEAEFEILGFRRPFAIARHLETGMQGTLIFQNEPRFYFGWSPDRVI